MRTMLIKELAELLNISPRTIRFYEEKGMISPEKHPDNQYRVFTEQDARRLQTIISLREVGMPIEEIRSLLVELDKGDQDHVLYALELQRSMMFSQFVELKHNIETTDRIINHVKQNQAVAWEHIFEITKGLKKLRDLRTNWRDHWDFDRQAEFHDELVYNDQQEFNQHPSYAIALQTILDWVNPHKGEKGLDIGTGTGNLAGLFLERGIEMCGIDQSKEMLRQCQRKFPSLETKLGNFLAIPYLDHSFDFAVTSYALHHLTDEQKLLALNEISRILKPHGRICIVDLMFEDELQRAVYLDKLEQEGKHNILSMIENEFYSNRSKLLEWFEDHDYVTKVKQMGELVHIIYAVPTRTSY
jgi:putative AdoMet-dependent methyltransferase